MRKAVFIVGPTAVGKTNIAFHLAKKFNGELVSADSVQVFKSLDIISGKDLPNGYKLSAGYYSSDGLPSIHLLDVVNPTSSFDVAKFYKRATLTIDNIITNGRLPIIVGGTGLYVEVILKGLVNFSKTDVKLRKKLSDLSIDALQKIIPKKTLNKMSESDKKNKRRLIRKIETIKSKPVKPICKELNYESLVIGLKCDREILKKRIDKRVNIRIKVGALEEAKVLFENYNNLARQIKDANGYKQLFDYLKGDSHFDEAIYRWRIAEYRHAKNQMTWFRKYGNVKWFDIQEKKFKVGIENSLKEFLR